MSEGGKVQADGTVVSMASDKASRLKTIELNVRERTLLVQALSQAIIDAAESLPRVSELTYLLVKVVRD